MLISTLIARSILANSCIKIHFRDAEEAGRAAFGAKSRQGRAFVNTSAILSAEAILWTAIRPIETWWRMKLINIKKCLERFILDERDEES